MKLKKKISSASITKKFAIYFNRPKISNLPNFNQSYKKILKLLFIFLKQKKKIITVNAPQPFLKNLKPFKNIFHYKPAALNPKTDVVSVLASYDLILVFTTALDEQKTDNNTHITTSILTERLMKEISASGKVILVIGESPKKLKDDYSMDIPKFTFKKTNEYEFLIGVVASIFKRQ